MAIKQSNETPNTIHPNTQKMYTFASLSLPHCVCEWHSQFLLPFSIIIIRSLCVRFLQDIHIYQMLQQQILCVCVWTSEYVQVY